MDRLQKALIVATAFVCSMPAYADQPVQTAPQTGLASTDLEVTNDGWVAFVLPFNEHNVILETSIDNLDRLVAKQIAGLQSPEKKGLLGVNLGDDVAQALKVLGAPLERRAAIDENTLKPIPHRFTYQYSNASFDAVNGKIASIKVSFDSPFTTQQALVLPTETRPEGLLQYAYQRWQTGVQDKYNCNEPRVISAQPADVSRSGMLTEHWQVNVCGQTHVFSPFVAQYGDGGYLVGFSK